VGPYLPDKTATIFISTGELSGEMHGAYLAEAIQQLRREQGQPPAIIEGNGSQRMTEAGVQLLFDVATWGEMGLIANLLKAQFFLRVVSATARFILSNQPDIVVLVDSRFLNISLAKHLRQRGYTGKIVYYVAPVRWQSLYDPAEHERSLRTSASPRFNATAISRFRYIPSASRPTRNWTFLTNTSATRCASTPSRSSVMRNSATWPASITTALSRR